MRGPTDVCRPPEPGRHHLAIDGADRTYEVVVPDDGLDPSPWPLVVALHGTGGSGSHFGDASGVAAEASTAGALVVLPDGTGEPAGWLHEDRQRDLAFVGAVIDEVAGTGCVDAGRVWLTGVSAGSVLAARLVCTRADVAGALLVAGLPAACENVASDLYVVHGTADEIIAYAGGDFNGTELATMPEVVAGWAAAAGCSAPPAGRGIEPDVFVLEWPACERDGDGGSVGVVRLYSVIGGAHGWFTDGTAAIDATCVVVAAATAEPGAPADTAHCEA